MTPKVSSKIETTIQWVSHLSNIAEQVSKCLWYDAIYSEVLNTVTLFFPAAAFPQTELAAGPPSSPRACNYAGVPA